MLERFVEQTHFTSQEDFIANFKVKVPENFNFGYDVVDAWRLNSPIKMRCCGQTTKENIYSLRMRT